jgi:hypothetical protein
MTGMKISVVDRHQEAYANRDIENFLITMDDKVKVYNLKTSELMWEGKKHARNLYGTMFSQSPDLRVVKKNRMVLNDTIIDQLIISGIRGNPEEREAVEITQVNDDNLISNQWFIF